MYTRNKMVSVFIALELKIDLELGDTVLAFELIAIEISHNIIEMNSNHENKYNNQPQEQRKTILFDLK